MGLSILVLLFLVYALLHLTIVQNWIIGRATQIFSRELNTTIEIKHVDIDFFNKLAFKGLLVRDLKKDTLLYAGSASVKISDWFFLKDKPVIKYLGLSNAVVKIYRSDSIWNYQFIEDYFSAGNKKNSGNQIQFDLKELDLHHFSISKKDGWIGEDQTIAFKQLKLSAKNIDINKKKIDIQSIHIEQPYYAQSDYTGERDRRGLTRHRTKIPSKEPYQWNNAGWVITADELLLTDGVFKNDIETARLPYHDQFDGQHLLFKKIDASLRNIRFERDTLSLQLQLATTEQCGFEVQKLKAQFTFTPSLMEFKDLEIKTPNSQVGNYYAMKYSDFTEDMGSFMHKVDLKGIIVNSKVSSKDIAYFAPELKDWNRIFDLNGKAAGTIDHLAAQNVRLKSRNTYIAGSIDMEGLPDINNTFIQFDSEKLLTDFNELTSIIPSLKSIKLPNFQQLGTIEFKGKYTGFLHDFVAYGSLNTRLGNLECDLNLKLPDNDPPNYVGGISTKGFDLGKFINQSSVGKISFSGKVKGAGFSLKTLKANFDGSVNSFQYDRYDYKGISIRGEFEKRKFNGMASIHDPNLIIDDFNGKIDFNGSVPQFDLSANISKALFKSLGITKDNFDLSGKVNFNFTGADIDQFEGVAKLSQVELLHEQKLLSLDSLELLSTFKNNKKYLELNSNELRASLNGQFNILALPEAFKVFLHNYYPSYFMKSDYAGKNQQFSFKIDTKKIDPFIKLTGLHFEGFNNSHFYGNLDLQQHQLSLHADVPYFGIGNKKFTDITLESGGDLDSLQTTVNIGEISFNDSLHFPSTQLLLHSSQDTSLVNISTRASMALNAADINARVITKNDGASVHFFPSSFLLNEKKWQILENGELSILKDIVHASNIKLTQGNQKISLETMPSAELENVNDVLIGLEKVNVDDFLPFIFNKPRLEGILTGNVQIENPFKNPLVNYQMKVDELRVDGDSIGLIKSAGFYNADRNMLKFQADGDNQKAIFGADGVVYFQDSSASQTAINIQSERFDLSMLNKYLGDIFSNIEGTANTKNLKISNKNGHYSFIGKADIDQGSLVVNYTQCKYKFSKQSILFGQDLIDFGEMNVYDTLGNKGKLTGRISHRFFDEFAFENINFQTNRLLLLNTVKKDNNMFYGKVIGNATLKVNGKADNILMDINGEPSKTDSSQIYILGGSGIESGDIDYIEFVKYGKQLEDLENAKSGSKLLLNMDLVANPACKIDVILDEATGDVIKGVGNGKLNIRVGNREPLSIKGRYDITKGDYTFNFQTLLKKYFTVSSGSIVWDGDPFKANIDIYAQYEADKVDFSNLSNDFRQKEDIIIVAHLTETLLKPAIDFKLKVPDGSPLKNNFEIIKRLDQFQQDKNDLNKQVTSILLFNTFINSSQGFITVSSGYNVIANTIGGVVSNALSGFFNKLLQKYVKNLDFNFDVNSSMGGTSSSNLQNTVNRLQAAAKSNLVYTLLNGRLILTAGVNLDYNNPYANLSRSNNVLVTPDITAEWILSKDGRIRIVAFNKTNLDVIGQRNRTGASLSYRKEADRVLQLFLDDEKKNKISLKNP